MGKSNVNFNSNFESSLFLLLKSNCLLFRIALEYTINQQLSILPQKKSSSAYPLSDQLMTHWILLQPRTRTFPVFMLSRHFHSPFLCNFAVYLCGSRFTIASGSCSTCQINAETLLTFTTQSTGIWLITVAKQKASSLFNCYPTFASPNRHFLHF